MGSRRGSWRRGKIEQKKIMIACRLFSVKGEKRDCYSVHKCSNPDTCHMKETELQILSINNEVKKGKQGRVFTFRTVPAIEAIQNDPPAHPEKNEYGQEWEKTWIVLPQNKTTPSIPCRFGTISRDGTSPDWGCGSGVLKTMTPLFRNGVFPLEHLLPLWSSARP